MQIELLFFKKNYEGSTWLDYTARRRVKNSIEVTKSSSRKPNKSSKMSSTLKCSLLTGNNFLKKINLLHLSNISLKNYSEEASNRGFFQKLMDITPISPHKSAHSKLLTQNKVIYEIQCMYLFTLFF